MKVVVVGTAYREFPFTTSLDQTDFIHLQAIQ